MNEKISFKYSPNAYVNGIFTTDEDKKECECCGKLVATFYEGPFYAVDEVEILCPYCIQSGAAAKKFDGQFQQDILEEQDIDNSEAIDQVCRCTPGYVSWQGNDWPVHCNDCCIFLDYVGWQELVDQVTDLKNVELPDGYDLVMLEEMMQNNGHLQGYLFRCSECEKYVLHVDCDQQWAIKDLKIYNLFPKIDP